MNFESHWLNLASESRDLIVLHDNKSRIAVGVLHRRFAAAALFMLTVAPLFLPFAVPGPDSALPACCRRDGKHHCAMMEQLQAQMQKQSSEATFKTAPDLCPYRSALFSRTAPHAIGVPVNAAYYAGAVSHPAVSIQVRVWARISSARSHQKRGPPTLLS
jgi:hypothetical protein